MSNHCIDVICKECGAIYCIRCNRITSAPNKKNLEGLKLTARVQNHYCKFCRSSIYIYP